MVLVLLLFLVPIVILAFGIRHALNVMHKRRAAISTDRSGLHPLWILLIYAVAAAGLFYLGVSWLLNTVVRMC